MKNGKMKKHATPFEEEMNRALINLVKRTCTTHCILYTVEEMEKEMHISKVCNC